MGIETLRISLERLVLFRHAMKRLGNRNVSRGFLCSSEKEKSFSVALCHNKDNENNNRNDKKKNTMSRKKKERITRVLEFEHYRSTKEGGPVFDLKLLCRLERQLNIEITYARRLGFMKQ